MRLLLDSTSPSLLRNATARVAAPSVCCAVACILLAAAPTAPPCFRRWRRSSPLLLPRGGLGIPESFASSPEAPLLGELAGASPTERLDEGRPDRIAFAGLNLSVTPAACHLPYRGEALAYRKASPLRQRLPLWGSWLRSRLRGHAAAGGAGAKRLRGFDPFPPAPLLP